MMNKKEKRLWEIQSFYRQISLSLMI